MPRGNGTGPDGLGPMTGRRMGYCVGNDSPGFLQRVPGYGAGFLGGNARRGMGRGIGRRAMWNNIALSHPYNTPASYINKEQELQILKNQSEQIIGTLDSINSRIKELEKDN